MTPVEELAREIRLLVLDVDGVLTDGGLYYDHEGNVSKRFHVQDGLGIKLAQAVGLEVAVITGLKHTAVERRVRELGIEEYHAGRVDKGLLLDEMCRRRGIVPAQVAYLGDDWVDAAIMRRVGLPLAVPNAQPEILALARWSPARPGGQGAVRETIAFLLRCQGKLDALWRRWAE
ncbi:MAG TPA: HAD-IIIA family hydrolase [Desulfovibrio sp.]|jgi:3-deoxy-D-manno-octulosonate 8-phosphate phosphatase (KDO 8-P phosphatase)|uniref:KdsC family phosphatase n=1 Tax=Desulfovibrio TaxID=872 RepID=UPI002A4520EA|nr:HAD-IIIA family hydrolase [Desulfovibrio sp.]MDY0306082.1 HAD-IIIA family hydrolase [Desulfovibrionaceae bacterium]HMM38182.1 HAD-IIIA family hydrolase [Desulfovibrio sp.]